MTPIKQAIAALEAAISDDQPYIFKCKLALAALRAQPAPPPYPEGDVVGPCVCGSWPGGKCLQCEWVPAQPNQIPYSGADENPPVFGRRWKLARDGFGLEREDMNGNYVHIDDALSVLHAAQPAECTRSHPHELMDGYCELRTEIARLTNENARLRAQPAPPPECQTEGEKTAYAFGWWKGIKRVRMAQPMTFSDELREVAKRAQPDHSELVKRLRHTASKGVSVWGDLMLEAADALEGKV